MSEQTKGEIKVIGSDGYYSIFTKGRVKGHKAKKMLIGTIEIILNGKTNDVLSKANAEHLVLCWNSHDDLLAACEAI
jgi:hypothetical protein